MHPGHLDEQHMWRFFSWMNFIVLVFLIVLSLGPDPWVLLLNHSHTWWCSGTFLTWLRRWIEENVILRLVRHCLCIFSSQWFLAKQGPIMLSRKYSFWLCDPCMKMMCPESLIWSVLSSHSPHYSGWVILLNEPPHARTLCEIKKRKSNVNIWDFYSKSPDVLALHKALKFWHIAMSELNRFVILWDILT